jgi:hypothetical protein
MSQDTQALQRESLSTFKVIFSAPILYAETRLTAWSANSFYNNLANSPRLGEAHLYLTREGSYDVPTVPDA